MLRKVISCPLPPAPCPREAPCPLILFLLLLCLFSCVEQPKDVTAKDELPPIYPDYTDVTIPKNIAPLNFLLRGDFEGIQVTATCGDEVMQVNGRGHRITFDIDDWKELLDAAAGKVIDVTVTAKTGGKWYAYKPFTWQVADDIVDPYLTYRLIEPDYEVWHNLTLRERCVETFDERVISDYNLVDNRCMNCHIYGNQDPNLSMMYIRGEGGGALLNRDGKLSKLNIKTADMVSGSVYYAFSPDGRYITFSTNIIMPGFHSMPKKRLEVFDTKSDVYVADLKKNLILDCPQLCDSTVLETFPVFSPDGKSIYYCAADAAPLKTGNVTALQYALVRIAFDPATGIFGEHTDTIFPKPSHAAPPSFGGGTGEASLSSVCHPKVSPDGRYLLYTVAQYGTFPIWHIESDQQLIDLQTGAIDTLSIVNSEKSDTYHCWSSNSRWFVFASKRDDGLYGKPYFCYIDREGKAHKPFVLPQEHPDFYDNCLKSFNAPELGRGALPFDAMDVSRAMKQDAVNFSRQ